MKLKNNFRNKLIFIIWTITFIILSGCTRQRQFKDGRIVVKYWEKWTGFEKEAMQKVVDKFNLSQDKIYVDMLSISSIERKIVVATASGVPPDICGLYTHRVPVLAEKGAILDLTDHFARYNIKEKDFLPCMWELITHHDRVWAMMTTPISLALHWNKKLFRQAGLDKNRPPKTIQELNDYSDRLTVFEDIKTKQQYTYIDLIKKTGSPEKATEYIVNNELSLVRAGFLPSEPGWWPWIWGYFFGGTLFQEPDKITLNSQNNIKAYTWLQSFIKKYGEYNIKKFSSGFGQFASSQNAFLSERVAMVLQGVWMYNFIEKYSPTMKWGAAPFPVSDKKLYPAAPVEGDVLLIPKGALNVNEAMAFIKFLAQPENMEILCNEQRKFSPLSRVSPEFYQKHKNPYIKVFRELAESDQYFYIPRISIWNEFARDLDEAFSRIWLQLEPPADVLPEINMRNQTILDQEIKLLKQRGKL